MSFNTDGLQPESKETIYNKLNNDAIKYLRLATGDPTTSVDTSDESFIGRVNDTLSTRLAALWSEADSIQKGMYIDSASGFALERLAILVGFYRHQATTSRGDLLYTGDDNTIVPEGSIFSNLIGDEFTNNTPLTITSKACLSSNIYVGLLDSVNQRHYEVFINGRVYTYLSKTTDTESDILTGLNKALTLEDTITTTLVIDPQSSKKSHLTLTLKTDHDELLNVITNPLLLIKSITVLGIINAVDTGHVFGDAGSITEIVTTLSGLEKVYNPRDLTIGTNRETDSELRDRIKTEYNTVGSGTIATITSILLQDENIDKVVIEENRLLKTNSNGLPAKTYRATIKHSNVNLEVAKLLWDTKPLGIDTFGDIVVTVDDAKGTPQKVMYTKATDMYVYFRIDYTKHPEEELPKDVRSRISEACTLYGQNTSDIGLDVVPKKFYGVIYNNTTGIDDLTVEIFTSTNPNLQIDTITGWTSDKIVITQSQIASFATNRFKFIPPAP